MKRTLTLILALALVLALFAACGDNTATTPTSTPQQASSEPTASVSDSTEPPVEESPYNYAIGKFKTDDRGLAAEAYDYELPISTTDEVLSFWSCCWTPQYVPTDGFGAMALPTKDKELTGINLEYIMVSSDTRQENFSVLIASDALCDIMCTANTYYSGTPEEMVEDGYFINVYDYKDYCPNYIYQTANLDPTDLDTYQQTFYHEDFIPIIYNLWDTAMQTSNYCARGDWLDQVGMTNADVVTWDDLFSMLSLFKSQIDGCEYPWPILQTIEIGGNYSFMSYDTIGYINATAVGPYYVVDGKVTFSNMNETDKNLMMKLNEFYAAGLIDPNWTGYANGTSFTSKITDNEVGYVTMSAAETASYKTLSSDTNCYWVPMNKPLQYEGQIVHVGGEVNRTFYGNCSIAAKNTNVELSVTYVDWRYSSAGSDLWSYGVEGEAWEYNDAGERQNSDYVINHPEGLGFSWGMMLYACNTLTEPCLQRADRKFLYAEGQETYAICEFWTDWLHENYDRAYYYPVGARLTSEQSDELKNYSADVITYIAENYPGFLDGSKPFTEWDSYVQGLNDLGMQNVIGIYQAAYDAYMA